MKRVVMLASEFDPSKHNIEGWYASEKMDGQRALLCFINGEWSLASSYGNKIFCPDSWLRSLVDKLNLPSIDKDCLVADGELWAGYNGFQLTESVVRRTVNLTPERWNLIDYRIFELFPGAQTFEQGFRLFGGRLTVGHIRVTGLSEAEKLLDKIIGAGGEGLVFRHPLSTWVGTRSRYLLKWKPVWDAEATIVGYNPGTGKYSGLLGSYIVINDSGKQFSVSGMTDSERVQPLPLGTKITYRYRGLSDTGIPKEARYLRVCNSLE